MKVLIFSLFIAFSFPIFAQDGGREIPSVDVKDLFGNNFNTGDIDNEGKPIIISFWATWCSPCKRELNNIAEEYVDWQEETGVKKIKVGKLAGVTYHVFKRNNRYQLKETHWFFMKTSYKGVLTPEFKEDITKASWKNKSKTAKAIKKTYPNIEDLFDKSKLMEALFGSE